MTVGEVRKICDGWQLVSVGHNGKFYFAVVQRDKIETGESEEK
jgi:hypothetical protein